MVLGMLARSALLYRSLRLVRACRVRCALLGVGLSFIAPATGMPYRPYEGEEGVHTAPICCIGMHVAGDGG